MPEGASGTAILRAMRVLFASSEVFPFSKSGGLADVSGALPRALAGLGHDVLVVSPWYSTLAADPAPLWIGDVEVPFDGGNEPAGVGTLERDDVRYAFVGHGDFQRARLYGFRDDVRRFSLFTRSVPQVAHRLGFTPDVVHVNDWHTAYLPMVLAHGWHLPEGWPEMPSVLTVHNVQYQGTSELEETLYWLRLPTSLAESHMNHFGSANALQAGLGFAWQVTTVSPTYAQEIGTPEYGFGLDGTFRSIAPKLSGLLNGLDTDTWDPECDSHIPKRYGPGNLGGKGTAKTALCEELELDPDRPLLGLVSRFADQKGIDLLLDAAEGLLAQGWSLALLGSGDPTLEAHASHLASLHAGVVATRVGFSEPLAHRIYAGADALAIPSRFEPCGLSQMIAMRYGTLPIARSTGGLRDTIEHGRTGFLFEHANAEGLLWAASAARARFGSRHWSEMVRQAMLEDFSWERSARDYQELYRRMTP